MNLPALIDTARAMTADHKGLLAMDESITTCNQRLAAAGIAQAPGMRRAWRELLLTAPDLGECISGVILHDETIRQGTADGRPFVDVARAAGILAGIKVDMGTRDLAAHPGEKITEGLDGLQDRLLAYSAMGARFAKWRAVITIAPSASVDSHIPSPGCIAANAHALARYAGMCQEAGLVPIVEPEVLMSGDHGLARCQEVTETVLRCVFDQLVSQRVVLEATILKPNMVLAGLACPVQDSAGDVADATLQCLLRVVPAAVAGIAFLSGGQSGELASSRLNAMHARFGMRSAPGGPARRSAPWPLSFSFARAIQHPALDLWAGKEANVALAQRALLHRARCNNAALRGEYDEAMEQS